MINVIMMCAANAVPLKVAQTVEYRFVVTVPANLIAGVDLIVTVALQGIVNANAHFKKTMC